MKKSKAAILIITGLFLLLVCGIIIGRDNTIKIQNSIWNQSEQVKNLMNGSDQTGGLNQTGQISGINEIDQIEEIEGKVSICASLSEKTAVYLQKQLQTAFPKVMIQVDAVDTELIKESVMSPKGISTKENRNLGYDIIMAEGTYIPSYLKEQGMLQAYKTPESELLVENYDMDGCWYPLRMNHLVLAYNPRLCEKNEVSNSFKGFAEDSSLKGVTALPDPLTDTIGLTAVIALGKYYGSEYYDKMAEQGVCFDSQENCINYLQEGAYREIIVDEREAVKRKNTGNDIEIIYPSDVRISMSLNSMIMKEEYSANRNVEVCEMITDWLLSRNGQECFKGEYLQSTRLDMNNSNYIRENSLRGMEESWQSDYIEMKDIYTEFCGKRGKDEQGKYIK